MVGEALGGAAALYAGAVASARLRGTLEGGPYASPAEADAELDALARSFAARARVEEYGRSQEGRPLRMLRIGAPDARARLLVGGHLHAGEYVGGHMARRVAARLLARDAAGDASLRGFLDAAQVLVAPLLNPDGAARVWRSAGWSGFGGMRFTASGVDPNRNFPFVATAGARAWNSARGRRGAATYRGPYPLSEAECLALAQLAARERFCTAIHFHSFGGVVYLPDLVGVFDTGERDALVRGLDVFRGVFQSQQPLRPYRPVPEAPSAIVGQLDAFLVGAFGTPSVTIEVGRPGWGWLRPRNVLNAFWLFNPRDPRTWEHNDVDASIHALIEAWRETGGEPGRPRQPELARGLDESGFAREPRSG